MNCKKRKKEEEEKTETHIMSNALDFDMTHHEHFELHPFALLYQMQF